MNKAYTMVADRLKKELLHQVVFSTQEAVTNVSDADIQKRLDRVLVRLGMKWSFFAQIMASLDYRLDESVPTLATDGEKVFINKFFWANRLNPDTEVSGNAHELLHVVLEHPWRRGNRDPRLWNVACDYKVNQFLEESGFILDPSWLRDKQYDSMSEEQIYAILEKQNPPDEPGDGGDDGDDEGGNPCEDGNPSNGNGQGSGKGKGKLKPDFDDLKDPTGSAQEQANQREKVRDAVIKAYNTYKAQGNGGGLAEYLSDRVTKVKTPWYELLLQYMQKMTLNDTNWRRINRRELDRTGVVTADIGSHTVDTVVVAVDTSGSIGRATLDYFSGHINTILGEVRPRLVRVIYCDCRVNKVVDIEDGNPIRLEVIGGGGTDFRPVFDRIEEINEPVDVLIYLTDTFGTYPDEAPEYPVVWASIYAEDRVSKPPFGDFLFIDESQ